VLGGSHVRVGEAVRDAGWVTYVRAAALVVFIGLIACGLLVPHLAGRLTWTVAIALLPLFIVAAGYHRWRRVCPLALVAQAPASLGAAGERRAGRWLQAHGYRLAFGIFAGSVWLRLVSTNGDGYAIAGFLLAISLAAFVTGLLYTGKTWCNYVCPISFIEKLYTEPRGLRETPNSQCATCTACRPACPDINQENSYWKDVLDAARRDAFFAFPGVVLAFYGYYYLQSGTWAYYFDGAWTAEPGLVRTAFRPGVDAVTAGFYFWPAIPRALAAALTLAIGGAVSFAGFTALERRLDPILRGRQIVSDAAGVRSVTFALAAFTAFVGFYLFAGAPTLRLVPGLTPLLQVAVVAIATVGLVRRLERRRGAFAEETLARRILANWPWEDTPAPRDLREAFLIHTIKSRSSRETRERLVGLYKTAVRDALESGVVSGSDVHRLESLRGQMHISQSDHERVMVELAEERRAEGREGLALSPEKRLQLESYSEALAIHLERRSAGGGALDDAFIQGLQRQYKVTADEHSLALDRLLRSRDGVAAHILEAPATIEIAAATVIRLADVWSPMAGFLMTLLARRRLRAADRLLQVAGGQRQSADTWRVALLADDPALRQAAIAELGTRLSAGTVARLAEAQQQARQQLARCRTLADHLRLVLADSDPYVRAAAYYLLESSDTATETDRAALADDDNEVARDTVERFRAIREGATAAESSILEKMVGLTSIAILGDLEPEELAELAQTGVEVWFRQGETLCRQGESGDEVFALLDGEVSVVQTVDGVERTLHTAGPGTSIGELTVLDPAPRAATVVAATVAVRVLRLSGAAFRAALQSNPAVSESVIRMLVRRLRSAGAHEA
jgi:hypothetical protein